jgi:hypothetical protein
MISGAFGFLGGDVETPETGFFYAKAIGKTKTHERVL